MPFSLSGVINPHIKVNSGSQVKRRGWTTSPVALTGDLLPMLSVDLVLEMGDSDVAGSRECNCHDFSTTLGASTAFPLLMAGRIFHRSRHSGKWRSLGGDEDEAM